MSMTRSFSRSFSRPFSRTISAGLGAVGAVLKFLAMVANSAGEMVGVSKGVGDLVEGCTSVRYVPDHEGIYRPFAANEPAQKLGRAVENQLRYSGDITQIGSDSGQGTTIIDFETLTNDGGFNGYVEWEAIIPANTGAEQFIISAELELGTAVPAIDSDIGIGCFGNAVTNNDRSVGLLVSQTAKRYTVATTTDGAGTSVKLRITLNAAGTLKVRKLMIEESTGRSDTTTPSEHIATTTSAVKKVLNHANGNTVDGSGVVTEAKGAEFVNKPKWYAGPAGMNSALYGNDLTNAVWVKTNMTPVFDAEGVDGVPSNGSTLTATAPNATVLQTITAASGKHVSRFFLRRKTGTGTVETTVDGGATWTAAVLTTAYQEFIVDKSALTNPQIGIRIVTSGDEVEVGNGECHLTSSIAEVRSTGPIFTAGAPTTVNISNLSFDDANHSDEASVYFMEFTPTYDTAELAADIKLLTTSGSVGLLYYRHSKSKFQSFDETSIATVTASLVAGTTYKIGIAFGDTSKRINVDGVWGTVGPYDGAFATGTELGLLQDIQNVAAIDNLQRYACGSYEEAEAKIEELMA